MIPTPFVSLRSTFPPDRGNRPSSEGAKENTPAKSLPLTREVAFAKQMTEGEIGRCGLARRVAAQAGFISAQEPPLCGGWPRNAPAGAVLALRANSPYRAPRKKGFLLQGGRYGRRVWEAAPYRDAPSVGAHSVRPRAATWGRPYES